MPRITDTRQRVREVAEKLLAQGIEPNSGNVRALLGKGSPNTIVQELKAWREGLQDASNDEQRPAQTSSPIAKEAVPSAVPAGSPSPVPPVGFEELLKVLQASRDTLERQMAARADTDELKRSLATLAQTVRENSEQATALMSALESDRRTLVETMDKVQARFEGMQKHMLLSIEQAREEARMWKERARQAQDEAATWRTTIQGRIEMLMAEKGELQGRLRSLSPDAAAEVESQAAPSAPLAALPSTLASAVPARRFKTVVGEDFE